MSEALRLPARRLLRPRTKRGPTWASGLAMWVRRWTPLRIKAGDMSDIDAQGDMAAAMKNLREIAGGAMGRA